MTNPYLDFVRGFTRIMTEGQTLPLGGITPTPVAKPRDGASVSLVFAPHPDDESIIGALPLRMRRELGHRVRVVAVTQGSRIDRQAARLEEMRGACDFLGFDLLPVWEKGLIGITSEIRDRDSHAWGSSVALVAKLLSDQSPASLFIPHEKDQHTTHQGTHLLVMDALLSLGANFTCNVIETEFWAPMVDPNLMVESSCEDVADLVAALSFHKGEVERNPYHLRLPAWMSDNVRRGGELVGGQGGIAPTFHFATLYRLRRWEGGRLVSPLPAGLILPTGSALSSLLG